MEISLIETVDVREAKKSKRKKSVDHNIPAGSWLKILGNTSKTNVGPADGCKPKVKTAGKITTPASIATIESRHAVVNAVFPNLLFLLK